MLYQNITTAMNWLKRFWKTLNEPMPREISRLATVRTTHVPEVYDNFTPRAQQVLALARKEADRFNHNFVGTEHLLLGLIVLGQGVAVNVLRKMGLELETVRMEVEKQVGTGPDQKLCGMFPYTPRVKKVLRLASEEARALNHTYVGTEHILLGLLREGDGVAARVLQNLDVNIEQTRQEVLRELDPYFGIDSKGTESSVPKTIPASEKLSTGRNPDSDRKRGSIDTSKRYDVYCAERDRDVVVYRSAIFKSVKRLFHEFHRDGLADFFELEQADGQIVFVAKYSVIKFCEPGVAPSAENIPDKQP